MPTYPIQLKRNGTAAATPSSLLHGEVALNYADGKLFWKDASNVIQSFTFQAYALSSHAHAASDITSGTLDAARIANDSITYAKLQNVSATDRLLGRSSAGSGDVEEITCGSFGRSLIGSADAAAARTTLSVQPTASPAFTGAATVTNDGNVVPLTVTNAGTANSFVVNDASGDTSPFVIDASGNVGIGTSSPSNKLSVSNAGAEGLELIPAQNANESRIQSYNRSSAAWNKFSINCSTFEVFCNGGTSAIAIATTAAVTLGGQLLVTTGSASACGVAFSGDTNTGLAQIGGADTASLVTAGVERVRCTSGGTIEVRANSGSISHGLTYNENGGEIVLYDETQTAATLIDQISTDTRVLELVNGSNLKLGLGGSNTTGLVQFMRAGYQEAMRIDASGNVGVGVSPSFRLDVLGSANCVAKIKTSAAGSFGCLQIHNSNTNGETSIGFRDDSDSDASSWVIGKSVGGVADAFGFYYNGNRAIIESDGVVKLPDVYEDTVGATNRDLFIDSAGKLGYVSSIRASKTNIAAIDDVSWLRDLTPVSFHYRKRNEDGTYSDEPDGTLDYGLIAEEVEPVAPELCFYDVVDGEPQLRGVHYSKLITPMLRYIQQLEARIAALEERVNA